MVGELPADLPPDVVLTTLQGVAGWATSPSAIAESNQLQDLYAAERGLRQQYAILRRQIDAANVMIESASGFADTVEQQRQRLDVVRLFRPSGDRDTCPVCTAPIVGRTPALQSIEEALEHLDAELNEVSRDRPKVDNYVRRLSDELATVGRNLEGVRTQIAGIVRESEEAGEQFRLDDRRLRVAGRVSYFLQERESASETVGRTEIERLEGRIRELEAMVNPEAKTERLEALQSQVSIYATELLRNLPFDPNYRNCQITFNVRQLKIRFVLGPRVMQMRDVGGDESYLSGHVATLLAFHRVFDEGRRPVPGVIVFDQLSRPFFPADKFQDEVEVRGDDREDLKKYFNVLFEEVAARKTLQIIVLEHALFADDKRYVAAVRARWTNEARLVPSDWPVSPAGSGVR
jgi:prefoldin subunit 5